MFFTFTYLIDFIVHLLEIQIYYCIAHRTTNNTVVYINVWNNIFLYIA
jgi:hypothetical protein